MSAQLNEVHRWQAVCTDCGFWDMELESEDSAEDCVELHNEEFHADAQATS